MYSKRSVFAVLLGLGVVFAAAARADDSETIKKLEKRIEELERKLGAIEQQHETEVKEAKAKAKEAPVISAGANGFTLRSADTNFALSFHGVIQADNRTFFKDGGIGGNDGFLLRKARPIIQGTVFKDFDFLFVSDFGGSTVQVLDANVNYRYAPWLELKAGKFKVPVGLEQLQLDPYTLFNERSLVTDLVPNRDVGFQLWGDIDGGILSYAIGAFNGVGDARSSSNADFEDHREVAARLFAQPFKNSKAAVLQGFGFGVAASFGNTFSNATGLPGTTGGTLPGFTTDGQQQFFAYNPTNGTVVANGNHWRLSPQGYYYYGPFGFLGEYVISNQRVTKGALSRNLEHIAWEITGSWLLTGEDATYGNVTPKHPFDLKNGGWGAWQLIARYAELDVDNDTFPTFSDPTSSAIGAQSWSLGLNWYLNKNTRLSTSYSHTDFNGGGKSTATTAPAAVTRQAENVLFTRVQLAF